MVLYTINPNVKTIADFTEKDRIAVPSVRISFNAMMLEMAAEKLWGDPHKLDHLTVGLGHPDAVAALSAGYGQATITAHIAVQPFTDRGLKLPGAHVIADSREVFGGPLTQITLLSTKQTKDKNPTLFKAVANALEESIKVCNADKKAAAELWKKAQNASEPGLRVHVDAASHRLFRGVPQSHRHHEIQGRRLERTVLGNGSQSEGRLS
jgi:NitT/TauT family transport system substrate-binding protein